MDYLKAHKKSISQLNAKRDCIVLKVASPQDITKTMKVVVDVLVVEQVSKCSEFKGWRHCTHFDPEFVTGLKHFGQDDIA